MSMFSFLDPERILENLNLRKDMVAAEFGCGSGNFTITLAKRLEEGMVYALDVQQEVLSALAARATQEKVFNIRIIRCDLESERGSTLPDNSLDLVLIPNVLFQAEDRKAIVEEAKRVLKKGGEVLIIDWKKESSLGPKYSRISASEVKSLAEKLGLEFQRELEAGQAHYALLFKKT